MAKILNLFRKEGKSPRFHDFGMELLEKNRSLEEINKKSELTEKAYRETELEIKKKEHVLHEKSELLAKIDQTIHSQEAESTKRMS
mgnify:FL=1